MKRQGDIFLLLPVVSTLTLYPGCVLQVCFPFLCGSWGASHVVPDPVVWPFPHSWWHFEMGKKPICIIAGVGDGLLSMLILFRKFWECEWVRSQVWYEETSFCELPFTERFVRSPIGVTGARPARCCFWKKLHVCTTRLTEPPSVDEIAPEK